MDQSLIGFDLFALGVLFVSGVMALMRGFVREALTVTAFVAAALAALWTRPVFAGLLLDVVGSGLIANVVSMGAVFLLVYLAVSFVTSSLQKNVKSGEDVTVIDRTLGFVFGLVRGLVMLGLLVLVIGNTMSNPTWMTGSRLYPLANASAQLLQTLAPDGSWVAGQQTDDPIARELERINEDNG